MKHYIIGTAGHIDHGKTALIEALTGYNGDEMEEEKKRGITIDLSFCNMQRGDVNIAFIDVPGHEKLLKNMISGAFGFDATLFAIDAKEGIMPQTIEHLEVLSFLGVRYLVFVITKSDKVANDILLEREKQIRELLQEYKDFELLSIFKTSIYDRDSINTLKNYLFALDIKKDESKESFFRYYCDRVFSIKGYGEIVTGTVLNGEIKVADKVLVSELSKEVDIRNIQIHSKNEPIAKKHQRAALNLNIPHGKLKKGYLLTTKGYFRGFDTIDVFIKNSKQKEIKHNTTLLFLTGSKHLNAKVHIYEKFEDGVLARLSFEDKVYLMFGDRFVLLQNGHIIAGGEVIEAINDPIKKSKKIPILKALYKKEYKQAFLLLCQNHKKGFGLVSSIQRFAMTHDNAISIAKELNDKLFCDEKELVLYPKEIQENIIDIVKKIYLKNPYALLSVNSIKLRIKWASEELIRVSLERLLNYGFLKLKKNLYKKADIEGVDLQKELEKKVLAILEEEKFAPTAPYNLYDILDIDRKLGDNILKKLTSQKKVIRIAHNLFITADNLSKIVSLQKEIIKDEGYIDIKNFRKKLNLSRKYLIGYLEYLDRFDEIKKEGDKRVIVSMVTR